MRIGVLFLFILLSLQVKATLLPDDQKLFDDMKEQLTSICFKDGKFLYDTIIEVKDGGMTLPFNCNAQLMALLDMYNAMERRSFALVSSDQLCTMPTASISSYSLSALHSELHPILDKKEDGPSCKKHTALQCMGGFVCAMVAGPLTPLLKYVHTKSKSINATLNQCKDVKSYECVGAALRGVWDNLAISAQAIWKLLGMVKDGAVWVGKKAYDSTIGSLVDFFSDAEEITSDQMLVASSMEPSVWKEFKKHPIKVAKELAQGFFKVLTAGIKSHYGCEKWSGIPFASKCITPMGDWECASCKQQINSICGVLGFAGGELLVAYLTGGATVAAKKMVQYGYKTTTAIANRVLKPLRAYRLSIKSQKAVEVLETTATVATDVAEKTYRISMRMKLRDLLATAGRLTAKVGQKTMNSTVFKVMATGTKKVLYPVRKYIQLTDWAFMRGYEHTGLALKAVESHALPQVVSFVSKYSAKDPRFVSFISDVEIGINVKTYGSYVASFDRGNRGREESKQEKSAKDDKSP